MKHLVKLTILALALCGSAHLFAQDQLASEVTTGTLHVIWVRQQLSAVEPNNPSLGLWVSLHSDDASTVSFTVTFRYQLEDGGAWHSASRMIDNDTSQSGSTYWVSTPTQCVFWVPSWPVKIAYSALENKVATLRGLVP